MIVEIELLTHEDLEDFIDNDPDYIRYDPRTEDVCKKLKWLDDNGIKYKDSNMLGITYAIELEEYDAMAFKLVWG